LPKVVVKGVTAEALAAGTAAGDRAMAMMAARMEVVAPVTGIAAVRETGTAEAPAAVAVAERAREAAAKAVKAETAAVIGAMDMVAVAPEVVAAKGMGTVAVVEGEAAAKAVGTAEEMLEVEGAPEAAIAVVKVTEAAAMVGAADMPEGVVAKAVGPAAVEVAVVRGAGTMAPAEMSAGAGVVAARTVVGVAVGSQEAQAVRPAITAAENQRERRL
jgi:hypothetical protein